MLPSEWGDVREECRIGGLTGRGEVCDDVAELSGIPMDDDRREEVEGGHSVMLAFGGSVPNLTASVEADGPFEGMVRLTLVEAELSATLHWSVGDPAQHEQGPFDTADLAQCRGEFVLSRISCEFSQDRARHHGPEGDQSGQAQDVRPVALDEIGSNASGNERTDGAVRRHGLEA